MEKWKEVILKRLGIITLNQRTQQAQAKISSLEKQLDDLKRQLSRTDETVKSFMNEKKCAEEMKVQMEHLHLSYLQQKQQLDENTRQMEDLQMHYLEQFGGLNKEKRNERLIVSFTSFPARIQYVSFVIERMLLQTYKPDEIVLWLSSDQFMQKEEQLPKRLLCLKEYGVRIEWVEKDTRAYKKIIPALINYPNDLIVILDDDLIYSFDHLEKLMEAHEQFPHAIIASRCHQIQLDDENKVLPYKQWKRQYSKETYQIKDDWFFTGGAGTLFPSKVFDERVLDEEKYMELAPLADDIWLNVHAAICRIPIVNTALNCYLRRIEGSQDVTLQKFNLARGENDVQLKKVIEAYRELLEGTIYNKK